VSRMGIQCLTHARVCVLCVASQFYVQDAGSTSGTFLRLAGSTDDVASRLSESGQASEWFELHDGDLVILGVGTVKDGGAWARRPRAVRRVRAHQGRPTQWSMRRWRSRCGCPAIAARSWQHRHAGWPPSLPPCSSARAQRAPPTTVLGGTWGQRLVSVRGSRTDDLDASLLGKTTAHTRWHIRWSGTRRSSLSASGRT
jgi:hypothetical protein